MAPKLSVGIRKGISRFVASAADRIAPPDPSSASDQYGTLNEGQSAYPGRYAQKGKVFQKWMYPFRGYSQPILEVPSNRVQRYLLAFEYYTSDPICNASTKMKAEFALGGLNFDVMIDEDEWPDWTPEEWKTEYNEMVAKEEERFRQKPEPAPVEEGGPATIPGLGFGEETPAPASNLPMGPRKPSPPQDQERQTMPSKDTDQTDPAERQPGQDLMVEPEEEVPATEITPVGQFVANKIKMVLEEEVVEKLDIPGWIVKFGEEAMWAGDAFGNVVDGYAVDDDADLEGDDEAVNKIIDNNALMLQLTEQYANAYKTEMGKIAVASPGRIRGLLSRMTFAAGRVSMRPEDVKKQNFQNFSEAQEEGWESDESNAIYKEFITAAEERAEAASGRKYTMVELQSLNPSAVWLTRNDVGETVKAELVKRVGVDASPLNIEDLIHWKWQGPDWFTYGYSEYFPAFRHIRLKRSLEEALAANAERFANPIIQVKVGTDKNPRLSAPSQGMLDDANELMSEFDRRSALVTPYHYQIEVIGMEGKPLRLEAPLAYCIEQQLAAVGIPKAFLWGDGGNFASVRAQFQTMIFKLKGMQTTAARIVITRILNRFMKRRKMLTVKGKLPKIEIKWAQHELDSDQAVIGLMNALANLAKSVGSTELPMSFTTLLGQLGHDYEQELYRKGHEKAMMKKMSGGQPAQPPNQAPQKEPPAVLRKSLKGLRVGAMAMDLKGIGFPRRK